MPHLQKVRALSRAGSLRARLRFAAKKTIGPVHERRGHWSLWGYRNTDGLGYHEFLQLCEDLGSKGMLVINCGLSCEGRNGDFWPDEKIPELIQDALDACEYALGSIDSKWGAVRARAGHPEPLPLQYVEIGNENHGPKYEALYPRFAAALKQVYPQLTLIADVHPDGSEMHDQHFYVAPPFFLQVFPGRPTRAAGGPQRRLAQPVCHRRSEACYRRDPCESGQHRQSGTADPVQTRGPDETSVGSDPPDLG